MKESFGKSLFEKLEFLDVPHAKCDEIQDWGFGIYIKTMQEVEESDYADCLDKLQKAGFKKIAQTPEDIRYLIPNAIYEKEKQIVTVTYNGYWKRIHISTYVDGDAEERQKRELFAALETKQIFDGAMNDFGAGNQVMVMDNITKVEYLEYLIKLDTAGFVKYAENTCGSQDAVYCTVYAKGKIVLTTTFVVRTKKLYVSSCYNLPLSDHLILKEQSVGRNVKDAKTKLHMLEMKVSGNSFVFQLKNGNFIVSDGGTKEEVLYLLDYLEKLTVSGKRPIIEAWFLSHAHIDHGGVLRAIAENPELAKRIYVEGVYYNEPNDVVQNLEPNIRAEILYIKKAVSVMETPKGETTKLYRPQTGQRYYFDDITVDILCAQEQIKLKDLSGDFNDSGTWCLFNIEGQKCLLGGDGDRGAMEFMMEAYDKEDMEFDVFTLLHHGHNTKDKFTDFCDVKTVLVTSNGRLPDYRETQNQHLKDVSKEWISWGDGTKILTFPYKVGSYVSLPNKEWIYHKEMNV